MRQQTSLAILLVIATVVLATLAITPVAAHDSQEIDGYELTFGGTDEPVITGERMWLQLRIADEDGDPVPELGDSLEWRLEKPGDEDAIVLDVSEKHGAPGVYLAAVIFTEPGEYAVHMEGKIEDTEVHTHFEKEVGDHTDLEYPASSTDDADEGAAAFPIGPEFPVGVGLGALGALAAFVIGRRISRPTPAST